MPKTPKHCGWCGEALTEFTTVLRRPRPICLACRELDSFDTARLESLWNTPLGRERLWQLVSDLKKAGMPLRLT